MKIVRENVIVRDGSKNGDKREYTHDDGNRRVRTFVNVRLYYPEDDEDCIYHSSVVTLADIAK